MEQNTCNEDQYEQEENNKDECFDKKKSQSQSEKIVQ